MNIHVPGPFLARTAALLADPAARDAHLALAKARQAASDARTAAFWKDEEDKRLNPLRLAKAEADAAYQLKVLDPLAVARAKRGQAH